MLEVPGTCGSPSTICLLDVMGSIEEEWDRKYLVHDYTQGHAVLLIAQVLLEPGLSSERDQFR